MERIGQSERALLVRITTQCHLPTADSHHLHRLRLELRQINSTH